MKKKNIILITVDEWRADQMGCMGHELVKTPHIDKLASEAMLFTNASSVSPLCVPSRTAMFTGQYVNTSQSLFFRESDHVNSSRGSSFLEALKGEGYKLGIAGKNHAFTDEYFEKWFDFREEYGHWGKEHGEMRPKDQEIFDWRHNETRDYFVKIGGGAGMLQEGLFEEPEPFAEEDCMSYRIAEDAIQFIEQNQDDPFCLYYSFPDPHWPTVVCEPYYSMYDPDDVQDVEGMDIDWDSHPFAHYVQSQVNGFGEFTLEERKRIVAIYYGMMTFIDKAVGMVMDKLRELNLDQETMVVFTADHGNFGGRYGLVGKTKGFHEALIQIPMIVKVPGHDSGKSQALVSNIDILPTLFDCMDMPMPEGTQGESFAATIADAGVPHRDAVFAEVGRPINPPPIKTTAEYPAYAQQRAEEDGPRWFLDYTCNGRAAMIKTERWKYCYYVGDREELYDLKEDRIEAHNLAQDPSLTTQKSELRQRLMDWLLTQPHVPYDPNR